MSDVDRLDTSWTMPIWPTPANASPAFHLLIDRGLVDTDSAC